MEAVAPSSDQAADLLQTMSLGSQTTTVEVPESIKKPSAIKYGSGDGGDVASVPVPSGDRSTTPLLQEFIDPNMGYLPNGYTSYYYGGPISDWDDYARYVNSEGVEMPPAVYGDNGSLMYHHGYGYAPYGAYPPPGSPVPTMGHDGQLYGPQHYQYPAPYYQPQNPQSASNPGSTPQGDVSTSAATEQPSLSVKISNGNTNGSVNVNNKGPSSLRPGYPSASVNSNGSAYGRGAFPAGVSPGYQNSGFGYDGMRSPVPWLDGPVFDGKHRSVTSSSMSSTASHVNNTPLARNQNLHHVPHPMGLHTPRLTSGMVPTPGIMNRMYSNNRMYGNFGNPVRMGPGFGSNGYDSRSNGRGWLTVDNKYKPRGRGHGFFGYGNENSDGLNELNRGPRAGRLRTQKGLGPQITLAVKGQNLPINGNSDDADAVTASDQYNREDFSVKYSEAKFFVIKSYSEDDIHKSIKYSMWASTPSGNKKLDGAFQEAQEKSGGCPVFLFFSVNTSGQFVGLAEMVGPVNFNKNLEYWQQDKWNGCFPVKWHIVKDVPNSLLKHITLENNDNKPVTNSRDTQEIKFDQGLQMLNIFKEHTSKVCILDDFTFYETRQKTLQERKSKQQQFQKQVWDGKHADRAGTNEKENNVFAKPKPEKPSESSQSLVDKNLPEDNVVVVPGGDGDGQKGVSTVVAIEKRVIANGVANS